MNRRHLALPRIWMLTDERQGEALWAVIERLPRNVGVIVRHYSLSDSERGELVSAVRRLSGKRGLVVALSGSDRAARRSGADAVYGAGTRRSALPRLYPVHDRAEIVKAERAGAALLLLSPAFATRSHPGARVLGAVRFGLLARSAKKPVIALGGMTQARGRRLTKLGAVGWAAIDAWIRT